MPDNFRIIVATTVDGGIGRDGALPWPSNRTDMMFFRNITTQRVDPEKVNAVIMGRRTWESLGSKPLPHRLNICITSRPSKGSPVFLRWMTPSCTYIFIPRWNGSLSSEEPNCTKKPCGTPIATNSW